MIPSISNTNGLPSNLPVLVFILAVDGVLAIIEDNRRHKADNEANSASCHILTSTYTGTSTNIKPTQDSAISLMQWADLTVGTIVQLRNRETAPADLLILSVDEMDPSQPSGICYVETKSLDGETNLKLRHACDNTLTALSSQQVSSLAGFLRCETPNRVISRFDGTLTVSSKSHAAPQTVQQPVSMKNVLLRGCQLRNTDFIYGLVVNTGPDTKIMQSAATPRPKWSSINQSVNNMIMWLFALLCLLCIIATTTQIIWLHANKTDSLYLQWYPAYVSQWFVGFGYYFLLMYQMIPVSLYVTISTVMFIQAIFMTWDLDMYYEELDVRMIVRSMGLNEELGQISYVFSDKTGTLTCNVMEFRKCSINGVSYGTGTTEIGRAALRRKGMNVPEEPPENCGPGSRQKISNVNFQDARLFRTLEKNSDKGCPEANFFLHLGLCHTVIPETVEETGEVRFSASSPDEQALVSGAKYFGFNFESRGLGIARVRVTQKSMMTNKNADSELLEFKMLEVLEFTSDRKRMSVITQFPNGEYWVLTKGADNMIYPLLSNSLHNEELKKETLKHLEVFGDDGLRTLTIAHRKIDEKEYFRWQERFKIASASLEEIEKRKNEQPNQIDELMSEIEQNLELLGATAIEDKLQDRVPETIANLMKGGMKVWMLTGDKQETAINISYACQLMDNDMSQLVLNCELFPTADAVLERLIDANRSLQLQQQQLLNGDNGGGFIGGSNNQKTRMAVVIDGECLEVTLLDERCRAEFLHLAMACDAVVCCRVSPSQKAEVVSLVRATNVTARTLSIGDGANDVAMIQRAHVGVGICGQEGMQAVNASDYAIGQFSYLEKLLLHHGRLNYKRMSILVGYMFYKNILMVLAQYFYMFTTGSSGQKFYSELGFQMYNIAYTSMPIILLGVFDYDVPWSVGRRFPQLYLVGPRMELFNNYTFFKWICSAFYESAAIFVFVIYGFNDNLADAGSAPMVQYGLLCFTLVVLIANFKLFLLQMTWTMYGAVLSLLGVVAYLPCTIVIGSYWVSFFPTDYGSFQNTLLQESYWMVIPICCIVSLLRHFAWMAIQRRFYPAPWQIVQEQYVLRGTLPAPVATYLSSSSRIDIEAGIPVVSSLNEDESTAYFTNASPLNEKSDVKEVNLAMLDLPSTLISESDLECASYEQQLIEQPRAQRHSSSGFAYSYDPQTTMAESYMTTHSRATASSAFSDAERRGRVAREDSRSSEYSSSASITNGASTSTVNNASPGLFV